MSRCDSSLAALWQQHRVEIKAYLKVKDGCAKPKFVLLIQEALLSAPAPTQEGALVASSSSEVMECHSAAGGSVLRGVPGMCSRTGLKWWFTKVRPLCLSP